MKLLRISNVHIRIVAAAFCLPLAVPAASTTVSNETPTQSALGRKVEESALAQRMRNVQRGIQAYEPNQLGYTKDEGNDDFMDFTVSLLIPLWWGRDLPRTGRWDCLPIGAVTLRSGQYVLSRSSAPVVGKRFNPLLGARLFERRAGFPYQFTDVVYAHESNGQSIASPESFERIRATYLDVEKDADKAKRIARDSISRGWDYFGVHGEWHWARWSVSTGVKIFMTESRPQGEKEEYKAWENDPEGKTRQAVDGFSVTVTSRHFEPVEASISLTTGLEHAFQYQTIRGEIGSRLSKYTNPRIFLWGRYGYNSDFINYYKKNASVGIAISFWDPPLPPQLRSK